MPNPTGPVQAVQVSHVADHLAGGGSAEWRKSPLDVRRLLGYITVPMLCRLRSHTPHVLVCTPTILLVRRRRWRRVAGRTDCDRSRGPLAVQRLLKRNAIECDRVRWIVLDEADELYAQHTAATTEAILRQLNEQSASRSLLQHVFVSATISATVLAVARRHAIHDRTKPGRPPAVYHIRLDSAVRGAESDAAPVQGAGQSAIVGRVAPQLAMPASLAHYWIACPGGDGQKVNHVRDEAGARVPRCRHGTLLTRVPVATRRLRGCMPR